MKTAYRMHAISASLIFFACFGVAAIMLDYAAADSSSERELVIDRIVSYLKDRDVSIGEDRMRRLANTVYEECQLQRLDYRLVLAVIHVESNFRHNAVSKKGARGLFQIKPSLAKYIAKDAGVDWKGVQSLHETDSNIKLGVYHLSCLIDDFQSVSKALYAYNVGTTKARGKLFGKEPDTPFTKKVLKEYRRTISVLPESD